MSVKESQKFQAQTVHHVSWKTVSWQHKHCLQITVTFKEKRIQANSLQFYLNVDGFQLAFADSALGL